MIGYFKVLNQVIKDLQKVHVIMKFTYEVRRGSEAWRLIMSSCGDVKPT